MTELYLDGYEKTWNEKERRKWKEWNEQWLANQIGKEGAKAMNESLKINTSVTALYLGGDEKIRKWREWKVWRMTNEKEK